MRAYREENLVKKRSALATLQETLKLYLRLFAPFLPYITEEIWSWKFVTTRSIHQENWPAVVEFESVRLPEKEGVLAVAIHVLTEIRGAKSQAQKNMKHPVECLKIECDQNFKDKFDLIQQDVQRAGSVEAEEITLSQKESIELSVVLGA